MRHVGKKEGGPTQQSTPSLRSETDRWGPGSHLVRVRSRSMTTGPGRFIIRGKTPVDLSRPGTSMDQQGFLEERMEVLSNWVHKMPKLSLFSQKFPG